RQFQDSYASASRDACIVLPSWDEILQQRTLFLEAELCIDHHAREGSRKLLAQRQQSSWILQQPEAKPLSEEELDQIYSLPFSRIPHPQSGDIPAQRMIRHSITVVRGCCGNCSFCAITRHQGPQVVSRSLPSVVDEAHRISRMDDFAGTISDLGGPTANLYGSSCRIGGCSRHDCLYPKVCEHLHLDEAKTLALLEKVSAVEGVRHVFISSGLRMEMLLKTPKLLEALLLKHTPGTLKIAPEHTDDELLRLMHKEKHLVLERFVEYCRRILPGRKKQLQLSPYIITGHPGSSAKSAASCAASLKKLGLVARQFQDFTPTPGTLSTAMFVSGLDHRGKKIDLPSPSGRIRQRKILEEAFHRHQPKKKRR
ncbi:MAG TPA: radical SAM protein, partial [Desulfopila sp.]|nr:radical SAM protein [Desulfopila sp.]